MYYPKPGTWRLTTNRWKTPFVPSRWVRRTGYLPGQSAQVIETLLSTAKFNGLDTAVWLKDTLEKLPTWPNSRIDELLPFSSMD